MFLNTETHAWNHYPLHYSCILRRVFLCLASCGTHQVLEELSSWILVHSPRYGLIIDFSLRDHVLLLFNLCLRSIVSEAIGLGIGDGHQFYFNCPVFCQVLAWYATQLGILFGEMNAKLFAIHLFKHLILSVAINFLMFSGETTEIQMHNFLTEGEISLSQVEDAVAAFRDRSLLEDKIKAVTYSRQLNCSQRYGSSLLIVCILLEILYVVLLHTNCFFPNVASYNFFVKVWHDTNY